jgi:hypothetical protein
VGWYLFLANIKGNFDAIGGNVLTKGFCSKIYNVGVTKMTITKGTYKKQKNIWIQFVAYIKIIWIYLIANIIPLLRLWGLTLRSRSGTSLHRAQIERNKNEGKWIIFIHE